MHTVYGRTWSPRSSARVGLPFSFPRRSDRRAVGIVCGVLDRSQVCETPAEQLCGRRCCRSQSVLCWSVLWSLLRSSSGSPSAAVRACPGCPERSRHRLPVHLLVTFTAAASSYTVCKGRKTLCRMHKEMSSKTMTELLLFVNCAVLVRKKHKKRASAYNLRL